MIGFFRRLIQRYGFFKGERISETYAWQEHPFFSEAAHKSRRLAQIARERDALKLALTKAKRDKKAVSPIYIKLRALSVEELNLESGK